MNGVGDHDKGGTRLGMPISQQEESREVNVIIMAVNLKNSLIQLILSDLMISPHIVVPELKLRSVHS